MDTFKDDPNSNALRLSVLAKRIAKSDDEQTELNKLHNKYDSNDDGMFNAEEVGNIIEDLMKTKKTKKSLGRYLSIAVALIAILGVSNIGTAFLADNLTKEFRVNNDGKIVSANNRDIAIKSQLSRATFGGELSLEPKKRRLLENPVDSCFCMYANHLESIIGAVREGDITLTFPYTDSEVNVQVSGRSTITNDDDGSGIASVMINGVSGFIRFVRATNDIVCTTMLVPNSDLDNGTGDVYFAGGTYVPNANYNLYWDDPNFPLDVRVAAETLGFTKDLWDEDYDIDVDLFWRDLTDTQKDAAGILGYNQCSWDAYFFSQITQLT